VGSPVRVLLVEDNQVFREALELVLGLRQDVAVVASVGDGNEAVDAAREHAPDVVVMDFRMPGLDGVEATAAVVQAAPDVAVVCLTAEASAREVEALFAAGAVACLRKDSELVEIVDAIVQAPAKRLAPAE
jgi:DNA-binding NarL/FixJ family response regulator